jgi:hypothetical protein
VHSENINFFGVITVDVDAALPGHPRPVPDRFTEAEAGSERAMITRRSANALVLGGTDPRLPTEEPATHGLSLICQPFDGELVAMQRRPHIGRFGCLPERQRPIAG